MLHSVAFMTKLFVHVHLLRMKKVTDQQASLYTDLGVQSPYGSL